MSDRAPVPTEIRRLGAQGLRILWSDGHCSEYANRYLRARCPCAVCGRIPPRRALPVVGGQGGELTATRIAVVGNYAVSIHWSDGHDSGIYSYETLRALCACAECLGAANGAVA